MKTRLRIVAVLAVASALVYAGCGDSGDSSRSAAEQTQTVTQTVTPSPELTVEEAVRVVRDHYSALNRGRFAEAWANFASDLQAELGPFETYRSGYDLTEGTYINSAVGHRLDADRVAVEVQFHSDDIDVCGDHVGQRFAGTWTVIPVAGVAALAGADVEKTGGGEPVRDVASCPVVVPPAPPPPDYAPPAEFVDPYDPPEYEVSSFCEIHDCIPNFPNGNGYIVQCEDGTYSHSGGIQGACSWHGGVAG